MKNSLQFISVILFLSLLFIGCDSLGEMDDITHADGDLEAENSKTTDGDIDQAEDGEQELSESAEEADGDEDPDSFEEEIEPEIERVTLELTEGCNPFAFTEECLPPIPSTFWEIEDSESPTGFRGGYPLDALPNKQGDTNFDITSANFADGAPPASPILVHFGADIDPQYLVNQFDLEESVAADSPIALFNMETGQRVMFMTEMDMNRRMDKYEGRHALIIRPLETMKMGDRHAVVIKNSIKDIDSNGFESPEAFLALRDETYTTNEILESRRESFDNMFEFLEDKGYAREDMLLAWHFQVASKEWLLGSTLSMRNESLELLKNQPQDFMYTIDQVQENPKETVWKYIFGTFEAPTYLTADNTFKYDENHHPTRQDTQSFEYTILIPKSLELAEEPAPLVVFGHGIFGKGRGYLTSSGSEGRAIQELANANGYIVMATDWIGMSADDQELLLEEIVPDLNRIGLITDRLQQALINNVVMTEFALDPFQEDPAINPFEYDLIDESKVYYFGVSLGGIMGASYVSLSPRTSKIVLSLPGAVWSNLIPRSLIWDYVKLFFNGEYPDPLVQQLCLTFMQARFDHSDPINLSTLLFKDPLEGAPERQLLMQEAIGDCLVPNMTTEMLARNIGVSIIEPNVTQPYGLPALTTPTSQPAMSQYHLVEYTAEYMPPESNVAPEDDNNVHWHTIFQDNVKQQVLNFFETGEIDQYCDGACDPI